MNAENLNSLVVIIVFGALILLAFLKFSNPYNVNKKANFWFALFLLAWASFWMEEIVLMSNLSLNNYFAEFVHYLQIYLSVFFYLSIVFYINPNYKFHFTDLKHFIIPGIYLVIKLLQFFNPGSSKLLYALAAAVIIFQSVLYTTVAFLKIRRHQKNVQLFSSDTAAIDLSWLERIIIILFTTSLLFASYSFLNDMPAPNVYINFIELLAVFFIAYYSLKQKEIYPANEKERTELIAFNEEPPEPDPKRKIVADEDIDGLKDRLTRLMTKQEPYLDSELNLVKLADMMSISSHQLSYLINTGFNENFFQYINTYRVAKAKDLLSNNEKNNLSILGIAFESGFNSKTSFNTTFKKITSKTPSEFKKERSGL
ncbi:MAG: helix-turn-helix domain-containing protein [Ferruginibacter sp.]